VDEEYLEALRNLRERILTLRRKKANLLGILDDLEAGGETEVDALEKEVAELQLIVEAKRKAREQEVVFRF